jgi:hypothetical protein
MMRNLVNDGQVYERANRRHAKVRRLTRQVGVVLVGMCLVAIWQDKAIAPPVHDGMQQVAGLVMGYIEGSEALSEMFVSMQEGYQKLASDS